jgi:hypothetical protein
MSWRGLALGVALGLALLVLGGRTGRSTGVEIGTAIQALAPNGGDGAARHTEQVTYDDDDLELVATYLAADGQLPGVVPPDHAALWTIAARVLPPAELAEIRQLNVVTDGPNGTLGMVHRSGMVANQWILSLDAAESTSVLEETIVHELGHLLTLRRDDLRAGGGDCAGVRIEIGCALAGSALADWATEFWPEPDVPAAFDRDMFVSEYAAGAVHEDLAESFLAYVLHPDEGERSTEVAAKLAFFDGHADLAAAATDVRARLAAPASR